MSRTQGGIGWRFAAVGLGLSFLLSCSDTEANCDLVDPNPYAFTVTVRDSQTGAWLFAAQGEAVDEEGARRAALPRSGSTASLQFQVPRGVHTLLVTNDGYQDWSSAPMRTRAGACGGFSGIDLQAFLDPL